MVKGFYSQKLADLFESDTNDIEEDEYFTQRQKTMEQKLSSIE